MQTLRQRVTRSHASSASLEPRQKNVVLQVHVTEHVGLQPLERAEQRAIEVRMNGSVLRSGA
jgi:hypothetical protein